MSERYLVTGVQLASLQILIIKREREVLIHEIMDKQFVGNSTRTIEDDVRTILKVI